MMGHGVATLLISAAAGYWVLTLAAGQKERLRKIGNLVGLIIIAVSLIGSACKIYCQISGCPPGGKYKSMYHGTGWMGKQACAYGHPGCPGGAACMTGKACPMTGKSMGATTPSTAQE